MSGNRVGWIVLAIVVLLLAGGGVTLGTNLVGSKEAAVARGTVAGWWIVWVVIGLNTLMAMVVAAFLFAAGLGKVPETAAGPSR